MNSSTYISFPLISGPTFSSLNIYSLIFSSVNHSSIPRSLLFWSCSFSFITVPFFPLFFITFHHYTSSYLHLYPNFFLFVIHFSFGKFGIIEMERFWKILKETFSWSIIKSTREEVWTREKNDFIKTTYDTSLDSQISLLPLGFSSTEDH